MQLRPKIAPAQYMGKPHSERRPRDPNRTVPRAPPTCTQTHLDCSETGVYSLRALRGCTGLRSLMIGGSSVSPMELARSGGWSKLGTLITDEGEFFLDDDATDDDSDDSGDEAAYDSDATVASES
jgi:hypothetical protein